VPKSPKKPKTDRLSDAQYRVLKNLVEGSEPFSHIRGRSQSGGAGATGMSLRRKLFVDRDFNITHEGRAAVRKHEGVDPS